MEDENRKEEAGQAFREMPCLRCGHLLSEHKPEPFEDNPDFIGACDVSGCECDPFIPGLPDLRFVSPEGIEQMEKSFKAISAVDQYLTHQIEQMEMGNFPHNEEEEDDGEELTPEEQEEVNEIV